MATAIRIEALPARLGDCLLVECRRSGEPPWRMLVDGGPSDTWPLLEARLNRLPKTSTAIDVAVVTHVDSDHIGGFIPFVQSDFAREQVRDFWFNGRQHLTASTPRASSRARPSGRCSPVRRTAPRCPGTRLSPGARSMTTETGLVEIDVPNDGPRITVLSPDPKRLDALAKKWSATLKEARLGTRAVGGPDVPTPVGDLDLDALAAERSPKDDSVPNGSSIGLLLEHRGRSVVLAGDGFGEVLANGLKAVAAARGRDTLPVDVFKLPHHGSRGNVLETMLAVAPAEHYVFSTNGDTFHHPDDAAVARTVLDRTPAAPRCGSTTATPGPSAGPTPGSRKAHGYRVRFPRSTTSGAVLELAAKS